MCPERFVGCVDRNSFPVPDASETREGLMTQYAVYKYRAHVKLRIFSGLSPWAAAKQADRLFETRLGQLKIVPSVAT